MSALSPEGVRLGTDDSGMSAGQTDAKTGQSEVSDDKLKDNPYIENTETAGGPMMLRGHGVRWLPRPWKNIKHIIAVSYVCYIFLIFPGAFANESAWEALKYKDLGAMSIAQKMAKNAVMWIYIGFGIGACILVILCIVLPLTI